jgi:hypothetical protein
LGTIDIFIVLNSRRVQSERICGSLINFDRFGGYLTMNMPTFEALELIYMVIFKGVVYRRESCFLDLEESIGRANENPGHVSPH